MTSSVVGMRVMVIDSDFLQFEVNGVVIGRLMCSSNGISWPPPEWVELNGNTYQRISMSSLSDEEAAHCPHVARGARYIQSLPPNRVAVPDLGDRKQWLH